MKLIINNVEHTVRRSKEEICFGMIGIYSLDANNQPTSLHSLPVVWLNDSNEKNIHVGDNTYQKVENNLFTVHTCGDDGYFERPECMPKNMTKEQAEKEAESLRIDGLQWARVIPVK